MTCTLFPQCAAKALALLALGALAPMAALGQSRDGPAADTGSDTGGGGLGDLFFEDARSLLHSYSAIGGVFTERGQTEFSGWKHGHPLTPVGTGFRYYERNGFVSGTIAAIAISLAGSAAASGPKKVESWESGGYRYTRTTYYSPAERQAMLAATSAAASGIFGAKHQSFDLQVYSRALGGNAEGYKATMLFGVPFADGQGMFDLGFGWGNIKTATGENGQYLITKYTYAGMPFRLNYTFGPLVAYAHWDWNWLGHSNDTDYNKKENHGGTTSGTTKTAGNTTEISPLAFRGASAPRRRSSAACTSKAWRSPRA
ncbi:MAG: hypothetical protein FJ100_01950 [Deltaproteobacteria bacterium]|nr:hypothetical protein [Deltaproteobacteria bacterium]